MYSVDIYIRERRAIFSKCLLLNTIRQFWVKRSEKLYADCVRVVYEVRFTASCGGCSKWRNILLNFGGE